MSIEHDSDRLADAEPGERYRLNLDEEHRPIVEIEDVERGKVIDTELGEQQRIEYDVSIVEGGEGVEDVDVSLDLRDGEPHSVAVDYVDVDGVGEAVASGVPVYRVE